MVQSALLLENSFSHFLSLRSDLLYLQLRLTEDYQRIAGEYRMLTVIMINRNRLKVAR